MEVTGQIAGVSSLLTCGLWGSNSGHQYRRKRPFSVQSLTHLGVGSFPSLRVRLGHCSLCPQVLVFPGFLLKPSKEEDLGKSEVKHLSWSEKSRGWKVQRKGFGSATVPGGSIASLRASVFLGVRPVSLSVQRVSSRGNRSIQQVPIPKVREAGPTRRARTKATPGGGGCPGSVSSWGCCEDDWRRLGTFAPLPGQLGSSGTGGLG